MTDEIWTVTDLSRIQNKCSMIVRGWDLNHMSQRWETNPGECYTLCCFRTMPKNTTQTGTTRIHRWIADQQRVIPSSCNLHLLTKKMGKIINIENSSRSINKKKVKQFPKTMKVISHESFGWSNIFFLRSENGP